MHAHTLFSPIAETNDGLRTLGVGVDEPVERHAMNSACAGQPEGLLEVITSFMTQ